MGGATDTEALPTWRVDSKSSQAELQVLAGEVSGGREAVTGIWAVYQQSLPLPRRKYDFPSLHREKYRLTGGVGGSQ